MHEQCVFCRSTTGGATCIVSSCSRDNYSSCWGHNSSMTRPRQSSGVTDRQTDRQEDTRSETRKLIDWIMLWHAMKLHCYWDEKTLNNQALCDSITRHAHHFPYSFTDKDTISVTLDLQPDVREHLLDSRTRDYTLQWPLHPRRWKRCDRCATLD